MGDLERLTLPRPFEVLRDEHRGPSWRTTSVCRADRWRVTDKDHVNDGFESGGSLPGRLDARNRVLVQQQTARGLHHAEQTRRGGRPDNDQPGAGMAIVQLDRSEGHHVQGAQWRGRVCAAVHARDDRRAARSGASRRGFRAWCRVPAERAQILVDLLPRVHVPQPARVTRLRRPGRRLSCERGLRP